MASISSLNIAVSALRAQQHGMSVTAHNIANANTEGFRRQEAVFTPSGGQIQIGIPNPGNGVLVQTIRRVQSDYMDGQVRMANQWLGMWTARNETLRQVEPLFAEPGENGLAAAMDRFWNSWQDLAAGPESLPARMSVVESGVALSDRIRGLYRDLRSLQSEINHTVVSKVGDINTLAQEIAGISEQIKRSSADGFPSNDLLDQRDLLLERLSSIVKIEVYGTAEADLIVSIGGKVLIQGDYVSGIDTTVGGTGWSELVWSDDGTSVNYSGGEIKGFTDVRDFDLEDYIQSLNNLATEIVQRVNLIHETGVGVDGFSAGNFFVAGTNASNISVVQAIMDSPARVACGQGTPGDNSIANAIANVRNQILDDGQTVSGSYTALVARIASQVREATIHQQVQDLATKQLTTQRESITGVSIDEEMANMIRFQQAYNAAARVFTLMESMIDTVINRMGIAGR